MILDTPSRSLQVFYETAATTTESNFVCFWADTQSGTGFNPGQSNGATNGSTPVTMVQAPAANFQRQVKEILIYNADSVSHNFTVQVNDGGTLRTLGFFTVPSTYTLFYSPDRGWQIGSPTGSVGPAGPPGPANPTVTSIVSAATITPNSVYGQYEVTAQAVSGTLAIPSGSPVDGQKLVIRIKDNGSAQALTWTTSAGGFRAVGVNLPTSTVPGKVLYVGCIYNSQDSFWDMVVVAQQ